MRPRLADDELDALLARARRETAVEAPDVLHVLIGSATFEPRPGPAASLFALLALSSGVFLFALVVMPALTTTLATAWWVPPTVGVGWLALKHV